MTTITDLVAFVLANPALVAFQSGRFYPVQLPQAPTLPASTYMVISSIPDYSHDGLSSKTPRVQIDCYAVTYLAAHALADAYAAALPGWKDTFGAPAFLASGPYDLPDDPDLARSRVSLDITIGE
jgi:hypothetical protein